MLKSKRKFHKSYIVNMAKQCKNIEIKNIKAS